MSKKNILKHIVVGLSTVVAVSVTVPVVMASEGDLAVPEKTLPILVAPLQLAQAVAEDPAGAASHVKKTTHAKKKHAKKKHHERGGTHHKKASKAVEAAPELPNP